MLTKRTLFLTLLGNILEYYDFLLFAHLGFIITPLFFPDSSSTFTHLLSLLLFGLAFITRPIGAWFFGKFADRTSRKRALTTTVLASIIPALGLALLPSYADMGISAPLLFLIFRIGQGIALGGESTTAGTYLIEQTKNNSGVISGILCASSNIGSLIGLAIAYLCLQDYSPDWLWRVAFLLGAMGSVVSYKLRHLMLDSHQAKTENIICLTARSLLFKRSLTIAIGALVGTIFYLPITYTNFYLTKILNYNVITGLEASGIALVTYMVACLFFGWLADRIGHVRLMQYAALLAGPFSILFFYMLLTGFIWSAQIGLTLIAASFGAPIHVVMNKLYPPTSRAFNVAFFFMIGASVGGLAPSLGGYLVKITGQGMIPAFIVCFFGLITYFTFSLLSEKKLNAALAIS